jgi:hypothetical protein
MTFANHFARGLALSALAVGILGVAAKAQNGSNYHVLNNNGDAVFIGIGAGGTQTALDGIGTHVPGEDCRGSLKTDPDGAGPEPVQFSYRMTAWRENMCVFVPGVVSGAVNLTFPGVYLIELNGLNANVPVVFTRPVCSTPLAASFVPYGFGPGSTVSFVAVATSALGPSHTLVLPDNGLVNGSGTATLVGAGTGTLGPVASGCYVVEFSFAPTASPYLDNIDAIYHYAVNSNDENQYWIMSTDEMTLWQSSTILTDGGLTAVAQFFQVTDYDTHFQTMEANTHTGLAPHGLAQQGPYYAQTENFPDPPGPPGPGSPNLGFDVGRGSEAITFGGLGGTKVPAGLGGLGNGAQDPAYGPGGTVPTFAFVTWDNKPNTSADGIGSGRVTWIMIDLAQISGLPPESDPDITKLGGTVKVPVPGAGFFHPITQFGLAPFLHTTNEGVLAAWPDPNGITSGFFGEVPSAGGSIHLLVSGFAGSIPCNIGLPVNLTYGTTGNNPGTPVLQYDSTKGDISGTKQMYLWK